MARVRSAAGREESIEMQGALVPHFLLGALQYSEEEEEEVQCI